LPVPLRARVFTCAPLSVPCALTIAVFVSPLLPAPFEITVPRVALAPPLIVPVLVVVPAALVNPPLTVPALPNVPLLPTPPLMIPVARLLSVPALETGVVSDDSVPAFWIVLPALLTIEFALSVRVAATFTPTAAVA